MTIQEITTDAKLLSLLDEYTISIDKSTPKASEVIKKLEKGLENPELIVPVLGSQGLGKSTLINAVIGENLLPSDADETTCVPVEIRYGTERMAKVHFQSGDETSIELSCSALRGFVDNNENAANEKEVSYIAIETPNELLKDGLVIVDLPGVGSLTQNNQETTMRYIKNLCTAIFVIPTVPTIRRNEGVFIKGAWSSFSSAIFVQNRWDDETDTEVKESVEFNTKVLKEIAKAANVTFGGKICVVNAYRAIKSRIDNDKNAYEKSNLQELLSLLEELGENRRVTEKRNFDAKVEMFIDNALQTVEQYIREASLCREEREAERRRCQEQFLEDTKQLKKQVSEISQFIAEERVKHEKNARVLADTAAENLRADIYNLIDGGIVDGDQLTEAFASYQDKYLMDAIENHYDNMNQLKYDLEERLGELADTMRVEKITSFEASRFENGNAFKWEKVAKYVCDGGGSVGGMLIGSAFGPIGTVVGGLLGYVLGSWFGGSVKNSITDGRKRETKRQIKPYIEEFNKRTYDSIAKGADEILKNVDDILNEYIKDREVYYEELKRYNEQRINEEFAYERNADELQQQKKYLEDKKGSIE